MPKKHSVYFSFKCTSCVIYKIDCLDCTGKYPGQTKQWIGKRKAKHKSDIRLKKLTETTGLTVHAVTNNHNFDFDKVTILDHIPNYRQRIIAEKMYICNTKNTFLCKFCDWQLVFQLKSHLKVFDWFYTAMFIKTYSPWEFMFGGPKVDLM
ncbi:hypothetical protein HA402_008090 [Bradysia odoriphaga]|nr:hypothetical protein HA402_008090 [Bradysia odoriphaga]